MHASTSVAVGTMLVTALACLGTGVGAQVAPGATASANANRVFVGPLSNRTGKGKLKGVGAEAASAIAAMLTKEKVAEVSADPKDKAVAVRVGGSYTESDGKLAFSVQFTDATGKKVLGSFGPVAGATGDYTALAEQTAAALDSRRLWGNVTLGWPPPASWSAHTETSAAWELFNTSNWAGALERFQKAEKLDPSYANAKYGIWVSYGNMGRTAQRDSMRDIAKPFMTMAPGLMNDVFTWLNASNTRDYEAMYQAGKRLFANDDRSAYSVALPANHTGRFTEVVEMYKQRDTSAYTRGWRPWDTNVMFALHALGRYDEAVALGRELEKTRGFDYTSANLQLYNLAALGKFSEVENLLARVNSLTPGTSTFGGTLAIVGLEYQAHGYEQQARDIFRRRVAWYKALPADQQQRYAVAMANALGNAGEFAEARPRYEALLRTAPDNATYWGWLGWIGVHTGDDALFKRADDWFASPKSAAAKSDALYYRAYNYALRGDCAAAEKLFREGLAVGISRWDYNIHWTNNYGKVKSCTALPALLGERK